MNSMPKNPIKQAKLLRIPTFSSKKNTAKTVIKMGAIKNIAVASARESSAIDIKRKYSLQQLLVPWIYENQDYSYLEILSHRKKVK